LGISTSMSELVSELRTIYDDLQSVVQTFEKPEFVKPLAALEDSANEIGKAWGHSWLGCQSRVYYADLNPPPPGAHFMSSGTQCVLLAMSRDSDALTALCKVTGP
jgi:hypothetical protein